MAIERRALAVLLATFVAGGVTGAGLFASFVHRGPPHRHGARRLPPPFEELDLSAEQRREAEAVFEKYRPQLEAVFAETQPRVKALRELMDAELMPVLTESQRERFITLKRERPPPPFR